MRILHVVNIYFVIPYFLGDQLLYFKNRGHKEYIVCSHSNELKRYSKSHGFEYKEVAIERRISLWKDFRAIVSICSYINKEKIDIVTGHTPKGALLGMIAATLMRVPTRLYIRHGLVYETSSGFKRTLLIWLDKLTAKLSTKVICVSPSIYNRSIDHSLNTPSKQMLLSRGTCNGVDTYRFDKANINQERMTLLKQSLNLDKASFVVGFTGRLVKDKGVVELIKAFNILSRKHENIALLLVGMFEVRDGLPQSVIDDLRTNPAIINTGYIENSMIEYYYALMDVFVLPSYREGFPTSILEASSMQLPVITTKVTGCVDSIIEGETGLFVEHNSNELAEKIDVFIGNLDLRKSYGKAGREFVQNNFEQHLIWHEIEKLYL